MNRVLLLILFCIINIQKLSAQQINPDVETMLDTIVVEAARSGSSVMEVPFSINFVDAELAGRAEPGKSLEELLFNIPGVNVNNRFNPSLGDRINIRGIGSRASFGVRGIKIILDNIPLTMPDGQTQLNNIDFGSTGSIEIIRGPSSSLYGNASGGVINIRTEKPKTPLDSFKKSSFSLQPKFLTGAYGFQKFDGKLSGVVKDYSYLLNFSKFNSDGYREHSNMSSFSVNSVMGYDFSPDF
jgi:iron complex outermembrane recepter protein